MDSKTASSPYMPYAPVRCDGDLRDPFTRVAVFRALVEQLTAAPLVLDTLYGAATADIGLVTAVS